MANDQPLTKETILDAAEQVFRRFGPDKTSVVDVARALHVSHGTLYRHFASKAALREAVTERWLHRITEQLREISESSEGSAAERLRLWFDTLLRSKRIHAAEDPELFAMFTAVTLEAGEMIVAHVEHLVQQIARIVDDGMKAGEFQAGKPEVVAKSIFLATSVFHHPVHSYEWSTALVDQNYDAVWRLVLSGLTRSDS